MEGRRFIAGFLRWLNLTIFLLLLSSLVFFIESCSKKQESAPAFHATPYTIQIPRHFPQELDIPKDNPMTVEGIKLGRYLFYDIRLSGRSNPDSLMSCATCHIQAHSFVCGIDNPVYPGGHPHGLSGIPTAHYMLPMINLVWVNHGYSWNGSVPADDAQGAYHGLEDMVNLVIGLPQEIWGDTNRTRAMIQSIKGYPELFKAAFGSSKVTGKILPGPLRSLSARLYRPIRNLTVFCWGLVQLTGSELNGYVLFMTEQGGDCFHCHGGDGNPLFTTNLSTTMEKILFLPIPSTGML